MSEDCRMEPENLQEILAEYRGAKKKLFHYVYGVRNYANDVSSSQQLTKDERDTLRVAAEKRIDWFERSERKEYVIQKEDFDRELMVFEGEVTAVCPSLTKDAHITAPGPMPLWAQ